MYSTSLYFSYVRDRVQGHREKIVLKLLWKEKANKEIGEQIFPSVRSVEKIPRIYKIN